MRVLGCPGAAAGVGLRRRGTDSLSGTSRRGAWIGSHVRPCATCAPVGAPTCEASGEPAKGRARG